MRVAHRWVACEASDSGQQPCLHSGAVDSVTQATKAAKQWHSRAASVWEILCGQAEAVERKEKTEGRSGRVLTHLGTDESAVAFGHAALGRETCSERTGGGAGASTSLLVEGGVLSAGGGGVAQVCLFHSIRAWVRDAR
jgi:hypothetical protein